MSLLPASSIGDESTGFYNGVATQSLRFNDGSSEHLTFTTGSASSAEDRRKITHSVWIKRGALGTYQSIYSTTQNGGGDYYLWRFANDDTMTLYLNVSNNDFAYDTVAKYRDTANWYHFAVIIDTTQSTDTDRVKIYANGVLQDKTIKFSNHVGQNFSNYVMDGTEDAIGQFNYNSTTYFDGYMCDFITTIGQDNSISDFGETKNGVWIAKDYSGSYGANGFRLQFDQTGTGTASASTIGADVSGNTNHWTSNNLAANDSNLPDSPENNFMTFNPLHRADVSLSLRYANLHAHCDSDDGVFTTIEIPTSGKWYVEFVLAHVSKPSGVYILGNNHRTRDDWTHVANYTSFTEGFAIQGSTNKVFEYGGSEIGSTHSNGTIYAFLIDVDNSTYDIYQNDTKIFDAGTFNHPGSNEGVIIGVGNNSDSGTNDCNFYLNAGQDSSFLGTKTAQGNTDANGIGDFYYTTKGGLALCSSNLPDVTIGPASPTQADDHFNTVLYTGNGGSSTLAVTGMNFQADWLWFKNRTGANDHNVYDTVRGLSSGALMPNLTNVEDSTQRITSIDADGFTLPATLYTYTNTNNANYVVWGWKAGGDIADVSGNYIKDGVAFTPTQGTIDANKMSVNTTAGFSIIEFTSDISSDVGETGTPPTIAHGLGVKPQWVIIKDRDGGSYPHWNVWHPYYQPDTTYLNYQLFLQLTNAANNAGWHRTDTGFTTNLFTPPRYQYNENGKSYIAYVFHEVEGFSKFGGYIGNNSTDGTFAYTGFRPAFLIIKRASTTGSWQYLDSKRNPFNSTDTYLYTPGNGAEVDGSGLSTPINVDFLSNGFKIRTEEAVYNSSGASFAYMAFAEQPFKFSNGK